MKLVYGCLDTEVHSLHLDLTLCPIFRYSAVLLMRSIKSPETM